MFETIRRLGSDALHASAELVVATIAGALVLVVFYPVTVCAGLLKGALGTGHAKHDPVRSRL